jgi:hypothetical protein
VKFHLFRGLGRAPRLALLAVSLATACADAPRNSLLTNSSTAPPEVQKACDLANTRCAHCHPIDRLLVARGVGVRRWQMFIEEMRLKPSSGISVEDASVIFTCMKFVEESCVNCNTKGDKS